LASTRLGERQEIGTFGIKSSVPQRSTLEFANKEVLAIKQAGLALARVAAAELANHHSDRHNDVLTVG